MSENQVQAFMKWIADPKLLAAFQAAAPEAQREMLKKAGLDLPLEQALAALKGERELAEQELDKVAGGDIGFVVPPPPPEGTPPYS